MVEDLYGGEMIFFNYQKCLDAVKKTVCTVIKDMQKNKNAPSYNKEPHFVFLEMEDYYNHVRWDRHGKPTLIKPREYKAIHLSLRLEADPIAYPEFASLRLEFKFLTLEDRERNFDSPKIAHHKYKQEQLELPHSLTDTQGNQYQFVVVDHHRRPSELSQLHLVSKKIDLTKYLGPPDIPLAEREPIIYHRLKERPLEV